MTRRAPNTDLDPRSPRRARVAAAILATLALSPAATPQQTLTVRGQSGAGESAPPANAQQDEGGFPSVTYGRSRASRDWVTLRNGARVAVDDGVEWEGTRVYLSLTWDLVAVEAASGATRWSRHVSAYWNRLSIAAVGEGDARRLVVELRPYESVDGATLRVERYDLLTGEEIETPVPSPDGAAVGVRSVAGHESRIARPFSALIGTPRGYAALIEAMFGAEIAPELPAIDFRAEVLFVTSAGDATNCNGFVPVGAWEDDRRVLLRYDGLYFQTAAFVSGFGDDEEEGSGPGGARPSRPYGMFVLPRADKTYVIEKDVQNLIGGPSIWKERFRAEGVPAPDDELARVPRDV